MVEQIPKTGRILVAEPFSEDSTFHRTVVLLCEHRKDGTFGLILNKELNLTLTEALPDIQQVGDFPLHYGGPVEPDTLHFLHTLGDQIEDSLEVADGIFWGGDFETMKKLLDLGIATPQNTRFYLGYSGWSEGQLEGEMEYNSWIVSQPDGATIFEMETKKLWRSVLRNMGGDYRVISNFPEDPSLN